MAENVFTQDLALAHSCTLQLARTCPEAENIEAFFILILLILFLTTIIIILIITVIGVTCLAGME